MAKPPGQRTVQLHSNSTGTTVVLGSVTFCQSGDYGGDPQTEGKQFVAPEH